MKNAAAILVLALVSAVPAHAVTDNPWFLQIGQDDRGSRFAINYGIRWDISDLKRSPRKLAASLAAPIKALDGGVRDILISTRLNVYGVVMRPFRDLVRMDRRVEEPVAAKAVAAAPVEAKPRRKLDLSPLIEDGLRDGRREARSWVIDTLFDAALPMARGASRWQKEAVAQNLVDLTRVWDLPL